MRYFLKKIREVIFPDYSFMWVIYSVLRESIYRPSTIFNRLNLTNISIYRTVKTIKINCNICSNLTGLFYDMPNIHVRSEHEIGLLRETLCCQSCGATMRQRVLAHKLLEYLRSKSNRSFSCLSDYVNSDFSLKILDTDCFSPLHKILKGKEGYIASKFLPAEKFNIEIEPDIYNINLESMEFKDNRFDVVLSSDVMEHVKCDYKAHTEITRVLSYGGAYIFTVPFNPNYKLNRVLISETGSGEIFLEKPHYHGDPLTGGILTYRIYGSQLVEELTTNGLDVTFDYIQDMAHGIYRADVFSCIKRVVVTR